MVIVIENKIGLLTLNILAYLMVSEQTLGSLIKLILKRLIREPVKFFGDELTLEQGVNSSGHDVKFSGDGQIISRESELDLVIEGTLNSQVILGCEIGGQIGNRLNPALLSLKTTLITWLSEFQYGWLHSIFWAFN